jgi:hypothetical protein
MGHLFSCIGPCFQHWVTSPLWVACLVISAHAFSPGSQVLYGSLVLLYLPMLPALGHKSSMGRLFYCICPCLQHWITSPLWVACSVVSVHALSTGSQVLYGSLVRLCLPMLPALGYKSSMGRLFGCICPCSQHWITSPLWVTCSNVSVHALSTGSQVLYGSLARLYLSMLSTLDHKSPLGHLF